MTARMPQRQHGTPAVCGSEKQAYRLTCVLDQHVYEWATQEPPCRFVQFSALLSQSVNLFHLALTLAIDLSLSFSGYFIDPFLSGIIGLFLHVRCIPHQNSQRLFWASVCECVLDPSLMKFQRGIALGLAGQGPHRAGTRSNQINCASWFGTGTHRLIPHDSTPQKAVKYE